MIDSTQFNLPGQTSFYKGKVRDVYALGETLVMVASDRISAFDVVLPKTIPFKGQVLNQIAAKNLRSTAAIVPNWLQATPDPNVSVGIACQALPVEMVIRGYLVGHAWRTYASGERTLCGVNLPNGMIENQTFLEPIITPTTKAHEGHDEDISRNEIIRQGLVSEEIYVQLEAATRALFKAGSQMAEERGLILVDTKYEFGLKDGKIVLIDEIHTPDSSRYFYKDTYLDNLERGLPQRQLSKEFVREWLIANGFQGKEGQNVPEMTEQKVKEISDRYIELYETFTGEKFAPAESDSDPLKRIEKNILAYLA